MRKIAKILKYRPTPDATTQLLIEVDSDIQELLERRELIECEVRFDDGRHISAGQRKKAYATINDIADYTGDPPEYVKEFIKYVAMVERGDDYISLADCTITEAREYINMLMEFAIRHGIELREAGVDRTDDIDAYLYYCLRYKRCAVCGQKGEIHHCEGSRVGMGNNRNKISNEGRELICLCRDHHTELHAQPEQEFFKKYKVYGIKGDKFIWQED